MKNPLRYGLGTLIFVGLLFVASWLLLPDPGTLTPPTSPEQNAEKQDPAVQSVNDWAARHDGAVVRRCTWPDSLPPGGFLAGVDGQPPGVFRNGALIQAVPEPTGHGYIQASSGVVRAFVQWDDNGCVAHGPRPVRVEGRVIRPDGAAVADAQITGCETEVQADADGAFSVVLAGEAFRSATPSPRGPRCRLQAVEGGPTTPVSLGQGGVAEVVVQAGG